MRSDGSGGEPFGRICERVCREQGWELLPSGMRVSLSGGRSQVVDLDVFEVEDRGRVRLSTRIGPAKEVGPDRMEAALRMNAGLIHGALAIDDGSLLMIDTLAIDDTGAEELEASVSYIASTADDLERRIFGTDEN